MKEFSSQTGGRYTYVDDIVNLQNLALAFASIFDDCDNFIVSGCEISGTSISPGLVYINGKLREFSGANGVTKLPQYIYESNSRENVPYASGSDQVGRNVYGCSLGTAVPTTKDPITNETPKYIQLTSAGGLRIKDAFFGKYCLILDPNAASQTVKNPVLFQNGINCNGGVTANSINFKQGDLINSQIYYNGSSLAITNVTAAGKCKMTIDGNGYFTLAINNVDILSVKDNQLVASQPMYVPRLNADNVVIDDSYIYNSGTAAHTGALWINLNGYNNTSTYYRDTYIGNGKGSVLLQIKGQANQIIASCPIISNLEAADALILKSTYAKTNSNLRKKLVWQDKDGAEIGFIGYDSTGNATLSLKNSIGLIELIATDGAVNIGPAIKENGTLLSDKYVLKSTYNSAISTKANSADVYTKAIADQTFANLTGGLSQFLNSEHTKAQLCAEIGAMQSTDLSDFAKKSQYLADMATTDANKKKIRDNIGAAAVSDIPSTKDSGWVKVVDSLYARQIGNVVSIQGKLKTIHSGTVFTLPNSIDAPTYAVTGTFGTDWQRSWGVAIQGGAKTCVVKFCNSSCGKTIEFSMTYMV